MCQRGAVSIGHISSSSLCGLEPNSCECGRARPEMDEASEQCCRPALQSGQPTSPEALPRYVFGFSTGHVGTTSLSSRGMYACTCATRAHCKCELA